MIIQASITPPTTSANSAIAGTAITTWVAISSLRLSNRSAITPA